MWRVRLSILLLFCLTGCSIPVEFVRPDGTLVVELIGHQTFRVGDHVYTTSNLEVALHRLSKSSTFRRVELYIPTQILHQAGFSCQDYAVAIVASGREWQFYEWTPGQLQTRVPTKCDFAVLS